MMQETKKSISYKTLGSRAANGWNKLIITITGIQTNAYLYFSRLALFRKVIL
ncbi:hypothetical protein [Oenococcus oeni]|uniref:Uncharacterized protein n=1 Tax=Oenococcus oeni AWRIB429 TaxID=655225 RepID=D3LA36_OENOE|nr:hypothetical protein [Oenococcus oeni]EFD88188.1 hypothetical protein AWRIB429_1216 [Oenococcus oeni AWRIB429]UCU86717.1 hypothetical protein J3U91_00862 [Oenococcus oeni]